MLLIDKIASGAQLSLLSLIDKNASGTQFTLTKNERNSLIVRVSLFYLIN